LKLWDAISQRTNEPGLCPSDSRPTLSKTTPMKLLPTPTCRFILFAALSWAALPLTSRAYGPTAGARFENNLSGSQHVGAIATPVNVGPSYQEARLGDLAPDGTMDALGFGGEGVVGAYTEIRFATSNSNSGNLQAFAGASWTDAIDLFLPSQFVLPEAVDHFELQYNLRASGGVFATADLDDNGFGLAAGSSAIDYNFQFGGDIFSGSQSYNPLAGGLSQSGSWGTITGTIDLVYNNPYLFRMGGSAYASVGNFFNFGARSASARADFGSTLIWGGITHVTAFNVTGGVIQLPDDFQLDLIGQQSGFNYWNAAVHPDAPAGVPDSSSALLLLAPALFALTLVRNRQRAVGTA